MNLILNIKQLSNFKYCTKIILCEWVTPFIHRVFPHRRTCALNSWLSWAILRTQSDS